MRGAGGKGDSWGALPSTGHALRFVLLLAALLLKTGHGREEGHALPSRECAPSDISFFRSLVCKDGAIGQGAGCACANAKGGGGCELQSLRSYLPDRSVFDDIYQNKHVHACDKVFALAFSRHLHKTRAVAPHNGYPQDCKKENECHKPSLGKYIRYNSLMLFHAYRGQANDLLPDVAYSFPFRWAVKVDVCKDAVATWACAFASLSQTLRDHDRELAQAQALAQTQHAGLNLTAAIDALMPLVDAARRGGRNRLVQLLLYARTLSLLSAPSAVVKEYAARRLVMLPASLSGAAEPDRTASVTKPPAVSMHVRQGDSCDLVLTRAEPNMTHYLRQVFNPATNKTSSARPCFSVDVYLQALRELHAQYGSTRVYLATDSAEMLRRIRAEPAFTWVLVNTTVAQYQGRAPGPDGYIDYLPSSANEAVLLGGASDLHLLSHGDIFLGAFSSHLSKLAYYAMVGRQMRPLPFRSLDYPLSCDTSDPCTAEDIRSRAMDVERIVMWAPECLRGVLAWSPGEDRDPCGIYS